MLAKRLERAREQVGITYPPELLPIAAPDDDVEIVIEEQQPCR